MRGTRSSRRSSAWPRVALYPTSSSLGPKPRRSRCCDRCSVAGRWSVSPPPRCLSRRSPRGTAMAVFHQMGHDSVNLLGDVAGYGGAILSPVNCTEDKAAAWVTAHQNATFEFVLDPQLYFPKSDRGLLTKWSHYPKELDTADLGSPAWWDGVNKRLVA